MSFLLSGGSLIYLYVDATNTNVCSFVLSSETANCIFTSSLLSGGSIIFLSVDVTNTLVCSFVLSPSDLCNCLLASSQKDLLGKLQKKTNKPKNKNAARLVFRSSKLDCFPTSVCTSLASNPSTGQLQTLFPVSVPLLAWVLSTLPTFS